MKEQPNNILLTTKELFKPCCINGCTDKGTYKFKIRYLNRNGFFCSVHMNELTKLELILPIDS